MHLILRLMCSGSCWMAVGPKLLFILVQVIIMTILNKHKETLLAYELMSPSKDNIQVWLGFSDLWPYRSIY